MSSRKPTMMPKFPTLAIEKESLASKMSESVEKTTQLTSSTNLTTDIIKQQLYYPKPESFTCEFIPTDFSLKTQISFTSSAPFDWCSSALNNFSIRAKSSQLFQMGNQVKEVEITDGEKFLKSLHYYISPSTFLPWDTKESSSYYSGILGDSVRLKWVEERWLEWTRHFDSLYGSFYERLISHFYMIHNDGWSILFLNDLVGGGGSSSTGEDVRAVFNPSTRKIRELLSAEGIEWETPFLSGGKLNIDPNSLDKNNELDQLNLNRTITTKKTVDPSYYQTSLSSSILVVKNKENLDKLYQFLKKKLIWKFKINTSLMKNNVNNNNNYTSSAPSTPSSLTRSNSSTTIFTPKKSNLSNFNLSVSDSNIEINNNNNNYSSSLDSESSGGSNSSSQQQQEIDSSNVIPCIDVPILICRQSFVGGTLRMNQIISNGAYTKQQTSYNKVSERAFKLDIEGPILPDSLIELMSLFSNRNDQDGFSCKLYTNQTTYGFNYKCNDNLQPKQDKNEMVESFSLPPAMNPDHLKQSSILLDRNVIQKIDFIPTTKEYQMEIIKS
eukprot:gene7712-9486_t